MKETMKRYFEQLVQMWYKYDQTPPVGCKRDGVDESFWVGETETPDWAYWLPKEKTIVHDFGMIEENLGLKIHRTIHDYFNSYWFYAITGYYNDILLELDGVLPGIELEHILIQLPPGVNTPDFDKERYKNQIRRYWTIGYESPRDIPIVVDVLSGKVYLWEWEVDERIFLCENLKELIAGLEFKDKRS